LQEKLSLLEVKLDIVLRGLVGIGNVLQHYSLYCCCIVLRDYFLNSEIMAEGAARFTMGSEMQFNETYGLSANTVFSNGLT